MSRRSKVALILVGLLAIALLSGAGYLYWKTKNYLGGEEFRLLLSRATSKALGINCEFAPIQWSGTTAYTDGFQGEGRAGQPIRKIRADQIRTEIDWMQALRGHWHLNTIEIQEVHIDLGDSNPPLDSNGNPTPPGPAETTDSYPAPIGEKVDIDHIVLQKIRVQFPMPPGNGLIEHASARISRDGNAWLMDVSGGHLRYTGYPDFSLRECRLRYNSDHLHILNAVLAHPDHGQITLSGEASLQPVRNLSLDFELQQIPVSVFVPQDWRARLTGDLSGGRANPDNASPKGPTLSASLRLEDGRLEALPILDRVADATGTREFKSLRLHTARCDLECKEAVWKFSNIKIESEGLLRIEGRVDENAGNLNGLVDIGTIPATLKLLPGAQDKVFTRQQDGYVWAAPAVTINGTLQQPQEDLSPRLTDIVVKQIEGKVKNALDGVFNLLKPYMNQP